ncbi:hypothetical protein Tco_1449956 [Tanacetum coccineum]
MSHTLNTGMADLYRISVFLPNTTSLCMRKHLLRLILGENPRVEFLNLLVLGGFLQESYSTLAQARLTVNPHMEFNVDIPNIHACKQTLDVSAGTSINVQKEQSLDLSADDDTEK